MGWKRDIRYALATTISVMIMAAATLVPATAHADGTPPACNGSDILRSLWAGANFDLNVNDACPPSSSNGNSGNGSGNSAGNYIALGDSVAAGLGLNGSGQASGTHPVCGVSGAAYPFLVASDTSRTVTDVACSGATLGDLEGDQDISGQEISPQLDQAFANGTPSLMTITAGANDMHWVTFLRQCYASQCGTSADSVAADALRQMVAIKLSSALADIRDRSSGTPPEVIVTGYYHPISTACSILSNKVTAAEITWMNQQLDLLNQTLSQTTASYSFARFVTIDFSGHELCTFDPWVQSLNDPAPFHPTAEGQRVIAQAVEASLQ